MFNWFHNDLHHPVDLLFPSLINRIIPFDRSIHFITGSFVLFSIEFQNFIWMYNIYKYVILISRTLKNMTVNSLDKFSKKMIYLFESYLQIYTIRISVEILYYKIKLEKNIEVGIYPKISIIGYNGNLIEMLLNSQWKSCYSITIIPYFS